MHNRKTDSKVTAQSLLHLDVNKDCSPIKQEWSIEEVKKLAQESDMLLTDEHILLLLSLREFYNQFAQVPNKRGWLKWISENLGKEKADSIYLMQLFGENPLKTACKLAGLPEPRHCL